MASTARATTTARAATVAAAVGGERHAAATATAGIAIAVPERGATAGDARLQRSRSRGVDHHRRAHGVVGGHLVGKRNGVAVAVEPVPSVLRVAGSLIGRAVADAGTILQSANGHDVATRDVELLLLLGVGVEGYLGLSCGHCKDIAALDVHVAVGIHAVVATAVGHDIATADGHVAG